MYSEGKSFRAQRRESSLEVKIEASQRFPANAQAYWSDLYTTQDMRKPQQTGYC